MGTEYLITDDFYLIEQCAIKLDSIIPPDANHSITMGAKTLEFLYTSPLAGAGVGAFQIEASGAFTGDLVHIHQHTGNPGADTNLMRLEAEDADVLPLSLSGAGTHDLQTDKSIFIGESINTFMSLGLTINQGGNDDEAISLKSSDVAHGFFLTETDTYLYIKKAEADSGGAWIHGIKDSDGTGYSALGLFGSTYTNADTTKSTSGRSLVEVYGSQINTGDGTLENVVANGNVFGVIARVGDADVTVFILDEDGDSWQNGGITIGGATVRAHGIDYVASDYNALYFAGVDNYLAANAYFTNNWYRSTAAGGTILYQTDDDFYISSFGSDDADSAISLIPRFIVRNEGIVHISNETNAKMTIGLTINQDSNDDEILAFKSSDVAHGCTNYLETDTFCRFSKLSAASGGVSMMAATVAEYAIGMYALVGTDNTTKSTSGLAPFLFDAFKISGASIGAQGANANLAVFRSASSTVWLVDEDGDTWQTGNITAKGISHSLGESVSTDTVQLQLGGGRTGNGFAWIDLVGDTTYSDYGFRIVRYNTGANTNTYLWHRGTGNLVISAVDAGNILFSTSGTSKMIVNPDGAVTKTYQPCFSVQMTANVTNMDTGTEVVMAFNSEVVDQGSDFDTSNHWFTAPVDGNYLFTAWLRVNALDLDATYYRFSLTTSNWTFFETLGMPGFDADVTYWVFKYSTVAEMDANDTAKISLFQEGGAAQADVQGTTYSQFSGSLLC